MVIFITASDDKRHEKNGAWNINKYIFIFKERREQRNTEKEQIGRRRDQEKDAAKKSRFRIYLNAIEINIDEKHQVDQRSRSPMNFKWREITADIARYLIYHFVN